MVRVIHEREVNLKLAALRIAGIYATVGALWILLSDRVVRAVVANPDEITSRATKTRGPVLT